MPITRADPLVVLEGVSGAFKLKLTVQTWTNARVQEISELTRYKRYKKSYQAYYQGHKIRILEQSRQWSETHPERKLEINRKHAEQRREGRRQWRENFPERVKAEHLLVNLKKYPLADKCEFCDSTKNLEHGHIDYDYPELYLTVCHACNCSMETGSK